MLSFPGQSCGKLKGHIQLKSLKIKKALLDLTEPENLKSCFCFGSDCFENSKQDFLVACFAYAL